MKKTKNQKGMTLVEVIVAMAIFSVVTTGFCMTASYCIKAQAKARTRLTEINNQTTTVEDFSGMIGSSNTRSDAEGLEGSNAVRALYPTSDKWVFKYPMKKDSFDALGNPTTVQCVDSDGNPWEDVLENDSVDGYQLDTVAGEVYQMTFFSSAAMVDLNTSSGVEGEYWITIYNYSSDEIFCSFETDPGARFFDNTKSFHAPFTSTGNSLIDSFGEGDTVAHFVNFGIKGDDPEVRIIDWENNTVKYSFHPIADNYEVVEGSHYCELYIGADGNFYNKADYEATLNPAPEGE